MSRHLLRNILEPGDEKPEVNLTPLIDVVFVILIMFILVAPLLEIDKINLANGPLEQHEHVSINRDTIDIVIRVFADDSLTLNKSPVSVYRLADLLKEARIKIPNARPQIYHDKSATFGMYQEVKNAVESAGYEEMDIVLKPSMRRQ